MPYSSQHGIPSRETKKLSLYSHQTKEPPIAVIEGSDESLDRTATDWSDLHEFFLCTDECSESFCKQSRIEWLLKSLIDA